MHAYWRAANYLTVGQIYLKDNPLLERPLTLDDVKPRLLGHWGTTSGLNFIYTHLNRVIKERDLNMMYIIGPGHGGPGIVAHTYLEGSYTELYPYIERNADGIKRLFRQFSWPYGIPSHVAPETPGSIHEGGELGYSMLHAFGAAYDNPDLVVACVVGRRRSGNRAVRHELALQQISECQARRSGSSDPASQRLQDRESDGARAHSAERTRRSLSAATATTRIFSKATIPTSCIRRWPKCSTRCSMKSPRSRKPRAQDGNKERPRWPMLILKTPKGWTGPKEVDGKPVEGTWRAHQVPFAELHEKPDHLKILESWMRGYKPEELFDKNGALVPELADLPPKGRRRMGMNPHANGGLLLQPLRTPFVSRVCDRCETSGRAGHRSDAHSRQVSARSDEVQSRVKKFPRLRARRNGVESARSDLRREQENVGIGNVAGGRKSRARRPRDGSSQRAHVPGLARGLSAHRAARLVFLLRGLHSHHRFDVQPARQMAEDDAHTFRGASRSLR